MLKILFLIIGCINFGFIFMKDGRPKENRMVDEINAEISDWTCKKYGLDSIGEGASMPGGIIKKFNLSFQSDRILSKDELRKYLLEITMEMIKKVNSNVEVRPFLIEYPFNEKHFQIAIYVTNKGYDVYDPLIEVGEIAMGILTFDTVDGDKPNGSFKHEYVETYQEALRLLNK